MSMTVATHALHPQTLPSHSTQNGVKDAIARASAKTGVNFDYLLQKANTESSLNPNAKAKRSTATGLYQFVEKTWLQMVRDYGDKYGLGNLSACIDDACTVNNPRIKKQILDLRRDPELSALMAAEYATVNARTLGDKLGQDHPIGQTELYLAHFLGANGASKFLTNLERNPNAIAAQDFRPEAGRNPGVFKTGGVPQTYQDIYNRFAARFNNEQNIINVADNAAPPATPANQGSLGNIAQAPAPWWVSLDTNNDRAYLPTTMVNQLLAAQPSRLVNIATAEVDEAQSQSALLILAQVHRDHSRYNA